MMKRLTKKIVVALLVFSGWACEDHLDTVPTSVLTKDNFYNSYEECRAATAALYNVVWYNFSSQFYFRIADGRGNNLFNPYGSGEPINNLTETGEDGHIQDGWRSLYIVITQAGYTLEGLEKALENGVSEARVNQCRAEARFMRGLAYWYLGSTWGNVPIVTDASLLINDYRNTRSNPQEDVFQFAIKDLEYAAEWLPTDDELGRVNKYSAEGILARLYITAACYARGGKFSDRYPETAESYYEKARLAAESVIKKSKFSLMEDYEELFRVQNNNNSESMFALQFVPTSPSYGVGNRNQDWLAYSVVLTGGLSAYGVANFASGELVKLMHDRGEISRKKATFFYPGARYDYLGWHTDEGYWEVTGDNQPRYPTIKKHVVGSRDDSGGVAINGNTGLATPMLRLAEVYLLYAEAILAENTLTTDGEALKYFNRVRTRAGMPEVVSVSLSDIWDERRCELAMEGQFWFDMLRRSYWDQDFVLDYMANQHRNEYYYYLSEDVPDGFRWRELFPDQDFEVPSVNRLLLPFPSSELTYMPQLKDEPVPYEFED